MKTKLAILVCAMALSTGFAAAQTPSGSTSATTSTSTKKAKKAKTPKTPKEKKPASTTPAK